MMEDYWSASLRLARKENKILREQAKEKDYEIKRLRDKYESDISPIRREIEKCTYIVLHSGINEEIEKYGDKCIVLHNIAFMLMDHPELEKQFTDVEQSTEWLRKGFYEFALSKRTEYPVLETFVQSYGKAVEKDENVLRKTSPSFR